MSDANERPADRGTGGGDRKAAAAPDPDAWATACQEDLAAEQARRRARYGPPPVDPVEELRRFTDAVVNRIAQFGAPIAGTVAQGAARQFFDQARAVVEPVVERNPAVFDHLAAAGQELLAAYRAAVEDQEGRWTRSHPERTPSVDLDPDIDGPDIDDPDTEGGPVASDGTDGARPQDGSDPGVGRGRERASERGPGGVSGRGADGGPGDGPAGDGRDGPDDGPSGAERIDLD